MQEIMIEGKPELVYMLKDGDYASVYIPVSGLDQIDDRRLREIEDQDGEMLYNMSRTTTDNGMNMLDLYSTYIRTVEKPKASKQSESASESESQDQQAQSQSAQSASEPKQKRAPGRPRGSRNKSSTKSNQNQ